MQPVADPLPEQAADRSVPALHGLVHFNQPDGFRLAREPDAAARAPHRVNEPAAGHHLKHFHQVDFRTFYADSR